MSSRFERVQAEVVYEAKVAKIVKGSSATRTARRSPASGPRCRARSAIVAHDGERLWVVRQPREATGEPDLLELPAGRLDQEGETPEETARRELAEEIGKAADHWEHLVTFYTTPGFTTSSATSSSPPACATSPARRSRASGSTSRPSRSPSSTSSIAAAATRRRSSACSSCATACAPRLSRARLSRAAGGAPPGGRAAMGAPLHPKVRGAPGESGGVAIVAPSTRAQPFEHLLLDFLAYLEFERGLSRNTLEAYRSDLLQYGAWLERTGLDALDVGHAELAGSSPSSPPGRGRPPAAPATLQRKTACLRSFYRHLRRRAS